MFPDTRIEALELAVKSLEEAMQSAIDTLEAAGRSFREIKGRVEALEEVAKHEHRTLTIIAREDCACGSPPFDDGNKCPSCFARQMLRSVEENVS